MSILSVNGNSKKFSEINLGRSPSLELHIRFSNQIKDETGGGIVLGFAWYITELETNEVLVVRTGEQLKRFTGRFNLVAKSSIEQSRLGFFKLGNVYMVKGSVVIASAFSMESVSKYLTSPRMGISEPTYFSVVA
ncbi:hypothetical protein Q4Q34_18480 [Flavivirga abyssicola]|uniref:hypothetical protein n=1 Tax=Flavivirga abyssicola TaxID=3063533 RepID=UPI0026DECF2D|nr:hypothetical protein [Flavivirga sp. MEBiC07777]WVK13203.1 hypothetical protein Q4Q34_18480 [Flavivirga sp. MEBiC07777]